MAADQPSRPRYVGSSLYGQIGWCFSEMVWFRIVLELDRVYVFASLEQRLLQAVPAVHDRAVGG